MELTFKRTVQITAYLLFTLAVTQVLYTILFRAGIDAPRHLLWGLEGLLFTILAAFAGAAMVQTKSFHIGWSAIAFSAALNVVQVSIGYTTFQPFREAASQVDGFAPAVGAVFALSFMIYNAAKLLVGLAALIFGIAKMNAGARMFGGLTAAVGVLAMIANATIVIVGRNSFLPPPIAGGSGVVAGALLAICLLSIVRDDH